MITRQYLQLLGLILFGPMVFALLALLVATLMNVGGLSLMHLTAWQGWQVDTYWHFLVSRLTLYSLGVLGWMRFRKKLLRTQPAFLKGLIRSEKAAALALLVVEILRAYVQWEP
ncbi:hypothetical protein [Pseudomonas gingeri]|uniref:Uncharacterized protein n=1 Tax=Pseudomonas gingeri TaxID=117681 RepID=A0A7Y7YJV0_9PSED|nr:hypothetical protein [Pseudomonas gingeri]NWB32099.1 hypothetical protein [Pseudomonas gingeri]NWC37126.1 hypothetical protein [Pseudomonas gingeri]NWD06838.1 hypothetical protein [Pseudomonas gingeri]NWE31436.1 hypothetical protein [Pseudomonas gingeri]NWE57546.1 hypothetical protein [Pseudomonas gingeri]